MMKLTEMLAVFAALALSIGNVMAVPSGKTVEFASPMGKVTFDGKIHADKGLKCTGCHTNPKLFVMKKGADKITMADINAGKFCGACHDGKKAFKAGDDANCVKCHKADNVAGAKAETPPAASDCASKAVGKDGKPLAGAAKASFMKKCEADAKGGVVADSGCAEKAVSKKGKPLSGAAKAAFIKKCEADAKDSK